MKLSRISPRALVIGGLVIAGVAVGQCFALLHAVRPVSPERFGSATFLQSVAGWHIGFLRGQHGAWLVRVPASDFSASTAGGAETDLAGEMHHLLLSLPQKAVLEACLYIVALLAFLLAIPALSRRLSLRAVSVRRRFVGMGALGTAVGIILFSPYLVAGYGGSAYTNWVGPGAYSYSGSYLRVSQHAGETVSYRNAVEALALPGLWSSSFLRPRYSAHPTPEWVLVLIELLPRALRGLPSFSSVVAYSSVLLPFFCVGVLFSLVPRRRNGA